MVGGYLSGLGLGFVDLKLKYSVALALALALAFTLAFKLESKTLGLAARLVLHAVACWNCLGPDWCVC